MLTTAPMLTFDQVGTRLGVDRDAVSRFVKNGELKAVNVSRDRNAKRKSWRVRTEDLDAFESSRLSVQTSNVVTTKRKALKQNPAGRRVWF